jgi:hypothetical protein
VILLLIIHYEVTMYMELDPGIHIVMQVGGLSCRGEGAVAGGRAGGGRAGARRGSQVRKGARAAALMVAAHGLRREPRPECGVEQGADAGEMGAAVLAVAARTQGLRCLALQAGGSRGAGG